MKTISAKYARQNFAEVLNEVYYGNRKILITKSGKPTVFVVSAKQQPSKTPHKK